MKAEQEAWLAAMRSDEGWSGTIAEMNDLAFALAADRDEARVLVRDLRDVGAEATHHVYRGACPDDIEGRTTRDRSCPACMVLLRADAMGGEK